MIDKETKDDIHRMMQEDLGWGDVTSESVVSDNTKAKAKIIAGESGYLAGVQETVAIFKELKVDALPNKVDGEKFGKSEVLLEVQGPAKGILAAERVALNLLSRMSGIATATRELIDKVNEVNSEVEIAATRKTAPLLRKFDKKAVEAVGGEPHRYHLGDFVLIKDNHLKLVDSIEEAVKKAKKSGLSDKIEVEVVNEEEALIAAKAGADIVMLDNFDPERAKNAVKTLEKAGLRDKVLLEASGGIDSSNVRDYAEAGVDVISSSYMTMKSPALDIKLEISEKL